MRGKQKVPRSPNGTGSSAGEGSIGGKLDGMRGAIEMVSNRSTRSWGASGAGEREVLVQDVKLAIRG